MQTDIDPRDLIGHKAVDRNGDKIGTIDEVYLDDATGRPEWATVRTGVFGRDAFVPLRTSEFAGEELRVPYDRSLVKDSPDFGAGQHLSPAQELQLYRYYGLDTSAAERTAGGGEERAPDRDFGTLSTETGVPGGPPPTGGERAAVPAPAPATAPPGEERAADRTRPVPGAQQARPSEGPRAPERAPASEAGRRGEGIPHAQTAPGRTDAPGAPSGGSRASELRERDEVVDVEAPAEPRSRPAARPEGGGPAGAASPIQVVCREEQLEVGTEWQVIGRARVRRYVTVEHVERRIPLIRERVRVERTPMTEAERAALSDEEIAEATEEVVLRAERPVVRKHVVPIERVRLVVERVTHEEIVREQLRREQVQIHDDSSAQPADGGAPTSAARPYAGPDGGTPGRGRY